MAIKKLIEVALPLEKINAASVREKSIRHGHPSTLHLWWARRPLATARAVIWASLVDDPSSHPEEFPSEAEQDRERRRLFGILEDLVVWENTTNPRVLEAAKAEIMKSTGGNPPALLDPFAGGGAIPLEAQRLGLEAHAHDLNPVAVLINKAMIEIPAVFKDRAPINPQARRDLANESWSGAAGLAEDIAYYGNMLKEEAFRQIGHLYPKVKVPAEQGGGEATVIAWLWARTVKCPNPACGCTVPLLKSFDVSKKRCHEYHLEIEYAQGEPVFSAVAGSSPVAEGSVKRTGATCLHCGAPLDFKYIREEGKQGKLGSVLTTLVAEGKQGRLYISPSAEHVKAANVERPEQTPDGALAHNMRDLKVQLYGMNNFSELYSDRQLTMLTTFSDALDTLRQRVEGDALSAGLADDNLTLEQGGRGALAYSQALSVYLAFVIDKLADYHSTICSWHSSGEKIRNTFGRQAIPMVWDYAEANPFCHSSGSFENMLEWVVKSVATLPARGQGLVQQQDAQSDCGLRNIMVSTDPPYYDNISYADLSDYFYIWLRKNLATVYPGVCSTMLVPKKEELVATPFRFTGGTEEAKAFFEQGMLTACQRLYEYARADIPVTIYYAYKQSATDGDKNTSSTGWETMLNAVISAGFAITGTWPMRTEMATRSIAADSNALASSIVLVCRKRPDDASQTSKKNFIAALRRELRPALQKLQTCNLAPVDLAQSAIGPGMGVFSRYKRVLEADGTPVSVRSALQIINAEIDLFFNEQTGNLDSASRFCVELFTQCAYNDLKYGEAAVLANAKGVAIDQLVASGVLYAKAGIVHLQERAELPAFSSAQVSGWLLTQQLTHALATDGNRGCAAIITRVSPYQAEAAKELAYRLYTVAERRNWAKEASAYNSLVVSWPDIQALVADLRTQCEQVTLDV